MPNRILKESIRASEQLNRLRPDEEVFFYRLLVTVDDYGRMDARPQILASAVYPLRRPPASIVEKRLKALEREGIVDLYEANGRPYLCFPTWPLHQRIRNQTSKFPAPGTPSASRGQPRADDGQPSAGGSEMRPKSQSDSQSQSETKSRTDPLTNDRKPQTNGQPKGERMKTWLSKDPWQEAPA